MEASPFSIGRLPAVARRSSSRWSGGAGPCMFGGGVRFTLLRARRGSELKQPVSIVWFRRDLRLQDNPALTAAAERGAVLPLYVWTPGEKGRWSPGAASRWWLHHSLERLDAALRRRRSRLVLRRGEALDVLREVARESGADAVFWNRCYEPDLLRRDKRVKAGLRRDGLRAESHNASLLFEPWEMENKSGKPFQVFTPFWKAMQAGGEPALPLPAPKGISSPPQKCASDSLDDLGLLPEADWAGGLRRSWESGEAGAWKEIDRFLEEGIGAYAEGRDRPDRNGTSRLSPYLHFGEIGPRAVWHEVEQRSARSRSPGVSRGAAAFLRELAWREFAYHLLFHFPRTPSEPLRPNFARFPWRRSKKDLEAWQRGMTGYPIVDAGMRQLWETGWMHNRVRMIAGSFLVKDLLIGWTDGAKWFWDTLVDADLANNTLGWQWVAGCGADAAPYFRVFNPVLQGKKFDPHGEYVRRYVPELAALPDDVIHEPWSADRALLEAKGVRLGDTYPHPIVDHGEARNAALLAYEAVKRMNGPGR